MEKEGNEDVQEMSPAEKYDIQLVGPEEIETIADNILPVVLEDVTPDFITLSKRMLKYLVEQNGLGLAGPQIGIKKAFFVYWRSCGEPAVVYNPKYYPDSNAHIRNIEGCLTYGKLQFEVRRYKRIRAVWYESDGVSFFKRSKVLSGTDAIVFQHETDHCYGITIATKGILI